MLRRQQWTGRFYSNVKLLLVLFGAMFCLLPFLTSLKAPSPRSDKGNELASSAYSTQQEQVKRDVEEPKIVFVEKSCPSPLEQSDEIQSPTPTPMPKEPKPKRINDKIKHDEVVHVMWSMAGEDQRRVSDTWAFANSLFFFRSCPIHFHLFVDPVGRSVMEKYFSHIVKTRNESHYEVTYYDIDETIEKHCEFPDGFFRGSRMKLCTPDFIPKEVSLLIGLDTDALMFDDIWDFYLILRDEFNSEQAIGLGPEMTNWYYLHLKWNPFIPEGTEKGSPDAVFVYPEKTGFNGGINLLNLDRLRAINWNVIWKEEASKVGVPLRLGDQDVWNLMMRKYPQLYFTFPAGWNIQLCHTKLVDPEFWNIWKFTKAHLVHGNCGIIGQRYIYFRDLFEFMDSSCGHHTLPAKEPLDELRRNAGAIWALKFIGAYKSQ